MNNKGMEKTTVAALAIAAAALSPAARADVKVVSRIGGASVGQAISTASPEGNPRSGTVTTLYKGNKIRVETVSGPTKAPRITIIDGDAGKIYHLKPAEKTYAVQPLTGGPPGSGANGPDMGRMGAMMQRMDIHTEANVSPLSRKRVIAGKPANGYAYTATISVSFKPESGGQTAAASPDPSRRLGTIQVVGEQWVTNAVPLPASAARNIVRLGAMSGGGTSSASRMPGFDPLFRKFDQIKGLPLASSQTVTVTGMFSMLFGGGGAMGSPRPGQAGKPLQTGFRVTSEAVSVGQSPLPAALFAVPAGYRLESVTAPQQVGQGNGERF